MTGSSTAFSKVRPFSEASPLTTNDTISGQEVHVQHSGSVTGLGDAAWCHDVCIEIKELSLLPNGWDGSVAAVVSYAAIDLARHIAVQVANLIPEVKRPAVVPSVNGEVVLEWHTAEAHLEISTNGEVVEIFYSLAGPEGEWEGSLDSAPINPAAILQRHFR